MPDSSQPPFIPAETGETYSVIAGRADRGLLIVCDHAGNEFPDGYGTLGLPGEQLVRHIAYDIGAAAITRGLAERLGVPAVLSRYSRLLIDLNRGADDPTLIMRISDGAVVPGNRRLDVVERALRLDRFYRPYHRAIDQVIDGCLATGVPPAIFSVHSFTDNWKGVPRPWHVAILWDRDARLAHPLLQALAAEGDLCVGDNEPYHGRLEGDCMSQHGLGRGLAHAVIEVRQDLISDTEGQVAWTARLARILERILADPQVTQSFLPIEPLDRPAHISA